MHGALFERDPRRERSHPIPGGQSVYCAGDAY